MPEIVSLSASSPPSWFTQCAEIHIAEIHHGVLPLLGNGFLSRMYMEIARAPDSAVLVVIQDGAVLAFLAGCRDTRSVSRLMLLRGGVALGFSVFCAVAKSPSLAWKLLSPIRYLLHAKQSGNPAAGPRHATDARAELLALAVASTSQRRGLGRKLIDAFEERLRGWGGAHEYWVSTNVEEEVSNAFYRSVGFAPRGTMRYHSLVLQQFAKPLPPRSQ